MRFKKDRIKNCSPCGALFLEEQLLSDFISFCSERIRSMDRNSRANGNGKVDKAEWLGFGGLGAWRQSFVVRHAPKSADVKSVKSFQRKLLGQFPELDLNPKRTAQLIEHAIRLRKAGVERWQRNVKRARLKKMAEYGRKKRLEQLIASS